MSISTVCISSATSAPNNYESDCLTDGSVAERIKNFMSKTQNQGSQNNTNNPSPLKPLLRVRPRRSMQDLSNNNNNVEPLEPKLAVNFGDLSTSSTSPIMNKKIDTEHNALASESKMQVTEAITPTKAKKATKATGSAINCWTFFDYRKHHFESDKSKFFSEGMFLY